MTRFHKHCYITFLVLDGRPYHTEMAALLLEYFNTGVRDIYEIQLIRIRHDEKVIGDVVRSVIFKHKADVIISVGEVCSSAVKTVVENLASSIPVIFVGVREHVAQDLVGDFNTPDYGLTGVVRKAFLLTDSMRYISCLYPAVQRLLIPYWAVDSELRNRATSLHNSLTAIGMEVILLPVTIDCAVTLSKIINYLPTVDGVMLLEGCYTNGIQPEIAYWCWWHEVVLIGSGPHAISNGAACSFGGDLKLIAQAAYEKTRLLWERKKLVKDIPVTILPNNEQFFVNIDMMRRLEMPVEEIVRICSQTKAQVVRRWTKPFKLD